jgi:hypothetical protein
MKEFESIRNAARVLYNVINEDYQTFLIKNSHGEINKTRVSEIEKSFSQKFMELRQIENAINRLRPFEVAANRHLDNSNTGNNSIAYRQAFDREQLRNEYLDKYKRL